MRTWLTVVEINVSFLHEPDVYVVQSCGIQEDVIDNCGNKCC